MDERFRSQLATLAADPAGGAAVGFLAHWWRRAGARPDVVVEAVVDLVAALAALNRLPPLCPPPGLHRVATRRRGDARLVEQVQALLATDPEAAQALVTRRGLSQVLRLAAAAAPDEPGGIRFGVDAPYEAEKVLLLNETALANRCRAVWQRELGLVTVLGFPADLRAVELLYPALLAQATQEMLRVGARTRGSRQSSLRSFGVRIGARLRAVSEVGVRTAAADNARLLPELAARETAVKRLAAALFPTMAPVATTYDLAAAPLTDEPDVPAPVDPLQDPLF